MCHLSVIPYRCETPFLEPSQVGWFCHLTPAACYAGIPAAPDGFFISLHPSKSSIPQCEDSLSGGRALVRTLGSLSPRPPHIQGSLLSSAAVGNLVWVPLHLAVTFAWKKMSDLLVDVVPDDPDGAASDSLPILA